MPFQVPCPRIKSLLCIPLLVLLLPFRGVELAGQVEPPEYLFQFGTCHSCDGEFYRPTYVAVDHSGRIIVADSGNHRIQVFDASGAFRFKFGSGGTGDGEFVGPRGVTVDSTDRIIVTDSSQNSCIFRVQVFDPSGNFLFKFENPCSNTGVFRFPDGVAVDSTDRIIIVDGYNERIDVFNRSGVFLFTFSNQGSGNGELRLPTGVAVDGSDRIIVADSGNNRIQVFSASGVFLFKFGVEGMSDGMFRFPHGIGVSSHNIIVADSGNNRIQVFDPLGTFLFKLVSEGIGDGEFIPFGVAVDRLDRLIVSTGSLIRVFDSSQRFLFRIGSQRLSDGEFRVPAGVAVNGLGRIIVADYGNDRIQVFEPSGVFLFKFGNHGFGNGEFDGPYGVALDGLDRIIVADAGNDRIQVFDSSGNFLFKFGSQGSGNGELVLPDGVALDGSGRIMVADLGNNRIQVFDFSGGFLFTFGSSGCGNGEFNRPEDIAVDSSGRIIVADTANVRIQAFDPSGSFLFKFGVGGTSEGEFIFPFGVAVDRSDRLIVTDSSNDRVQVFGRKRFEHLDVDLFSDSNRNQLRDPGEELATTSIGGEVRFLADYTNTGTGAVRVTPALEGITAKWFQPLSPFLVLSGESRRESIVVGVPEDAAVAGSYPLTLRAQTERGTATASGQLEVVGIPLISDLLPPDGIVTARLSVTISWRTSAETTGRAHLKNLETEVESQETATPEYSREHRVEFDTLALGALYEWWVESTGRWGGKSVGPSDPQNPATPIPRRLLVGNGVVFTQREYTFDVERDYNQIVALGIENLSDETRDVVLRLENPYPDVAIGFVGTGSVEEPAVLRGSETKPVELGVHLQDADPSRKIPYVFTAELRSTRGGTSVVVDTALVRVRVTTPGVRFSVDEIGGPDPCSLTKTFRVTNVGDTVPDLRVRLSEGLAGRVAVAPSITSATVPSGGTLDFQLVPVGLLDQAMSGSVEVSAAGKTQSKAVELMPPAGRTFRTVRLNNILLCVESADSGCLNRGRFSIPLEIPSTVKKESIQSATLHLRFTPRSENAGVTYRFTVSLNGREIETLSRPVGDYSFEVPLEALRVSGGQSSVNTVTMTVSGFNAGSYYIASNALLCVCLSEYECGAYAASDADAVKCCLGRPGVRATPVGNLTAEVVVEPVQVVEGETAKIRATIRTGGVLAEGLVVTARTSDGQRFRGLSEMSPGVYEGAWAPSCAGDVTLEVHVAACPGGVIATKVVRVESAAERILSVPYYDPEGTAWNWACAMSGLLRYHGYGVKPWTIAAALGAEPSQGLDLRETAADLREPSLKSLLAYLRSGLGVLPGVKKYAVTDAVNLSCELRGKIQQGHPIWLAYGNGSTGDAEVLLVVGASGDTLWVDELGTAARLRVPLSEATLTGRLFPTPDSVAVSVELLSVAPGDGTGLSLSVPPRVPGATSGGLRIVHTAGSEELKLLWDGRQPLGYTLSNPGNNPADSSHWMPPAPVFPPDAATGWSPLVGDELELGVEVANAGATSRELTVEAVLEHLRSSQRVERVSDIATITAGEGNGVVEVLRKENGFLLERNGNYELKARLVEGGQVVDSLSVPFRVRCPDGVQFLRGDVGRRTFGGAAFPANGVLQIADAIAILSWLFLDVGQTVLDCEKAADLNDDGLINITDPIYLLGFLFNGDKGPPAPPYPALGPDPTPDNLDCCQYPGGAP